MSNKAKLILIIIISLTLLLLPSVSIADENDLVEKDLSDNKVSEEKKIIKELIDKRTSNSKHYLLEDGTVRAIITMNDQHFEDENGNWHDIVTELVDEADIDLIDVPISKEAAKAAKEIAKNIKEKKANNILDRSQTAYKALQVPFDVKLPKQFNKGYSIGKGNDKLTFVPVAASKTVVGEVYQQNTLKYTDAWTDTDVTLELLDMGLKETIILKSSNAPSSFSFEVTGSLADDLTAGELRLLPAWLKDAEGAERNVAQTIRREDDKVYVDLIADVDGLVYPIEIDPTIKINTTSADSFITQGGSGYNSTYLAVGANSRKYYYSYVKFDLSAIPQDVKINSAAIAFNLKQNLVFSGETLRIIMDRVIQPWNENTISDSNKPLTVPLADTINNKVGVTRYVYPGNYMGMWYVTDEVQKINDGVYENYGFRLYPDRIDWDYVLFSSREDTSNHPYMTVSYTIPPTEPIVSMPNGGEIWDSQHTITWNAATDPDTTQANLKYNIQLSTDNGLTWKDIVGLTNAGAISYDYDFINEPEANSALIRIRAFDGINYGPWNQSDATFTIKHNQAPNIPTNLNPGTTLSTEPEIVVSTPTLNWTFTDPNIEDTQSAYQIVIYDLLDTLIYDSGWVNSSISSFTITSGALTRNNTYYWKVKVKDNYGAESPLSSEKYIKINNLPTLTITSYTDGEQLLDNILTFTWDYNDLDGHTQTKHQLVGSKDNWATWAYNSGVITSSATTHTASQLADGEWDFAIRVFDGFEWSAWVYRSNLSMPDYGKPTIASPIEGLATTNNLPIISWNVQDITQTEYLVQLATDNEFTQNLEDTGWIISTATSHQFAVKADETWYARVKVKDQAGIARNWSEPISFTIDTLAPDAPNPTISEIGSTFTTISWNPFSDTTLSSGLDNLTFYMQKWNGTDWENIDIDGDGVNDESLTYFDEITSLTINRLEPETRYRYMIVYQDKATNSSNAIYHEVITERVTYNFVYDANNRLTHILIDDQIITGFIYDDNGNLIKIERYDTF